jgi:ketosteroid isomerase-like protein
MSTRSVLLAVLALALSGTACQPPAQEAAGLSEEDVAAIRNNVEQEVVQIALAGDSAAFAAEHTEDAVRLPPNAPLIKGRADIEASYLPFNLTDLTQTLEEVEGRGDLAYARWTYELTGTVEGVPITDQGRKARGPRYRAAVMAAAEGRQRRRWVTITRGGGFGGNETAIKIAIKGDRERPKE